MKSALSTELQAIVTERVASGDYDSDVEVLRQALALLVTRDSARAGRLAVLDEKVASALRHSEEGKSRPFSVEEFLRNAHERRGG
ncbi:MAG: Arc/MetJ-type ribon-helix-helix transcriptional regulator [Bradymonadia bacterium]|jgi:Arc/MetJ-type ribon-helix-helix transcriptional regulator